MTTGVPNALTDRAAPLLSYVHEAASLDGRPAHQTNASGRMTGAAPEPTLAMNNAVRRTRPATGTSVARTGTQASLRLTDSGRVADGQPGERSGGYTSRAEGASRSTEYAELNWTISTIASRSIVRIPGHITRAIETLN